MTLIKSLKYQPSEEGRETIKRHIIHTSKKNRRPHPISLNCKVYKDRLQRLKEEEDLQEFKRLDKLIKL